MNLFLYLLVFLAILASKEDAIIILPIFQAQLFILMWICGYRKREKYAHIILTSIPVYIIYLCFLMWFWQFKAVNYSHATELSSMGLLENTTAILGYLPTEISSFLLGNITGLVSFIWRASNPYMSDFGWHHGVLSPVFIISTMILFFSTSKGISNKNKWAFIIILLTPLLITTYFHYKSYQNKEYRTSRYYEMERYNKTYSSSHRERGALNEVIEFMKDKDYIETTLYLSGFFADKEHTYFETGNDEKIYPPTNKTVKEEVRYSIYPKKGASCFTPLWWRCPVVTGRVLLENEFFVVFEGKPLSLT